ncbi:baseplate assembly protein [Profundibacter sp.]
MSAFAAINLDKLPAPELVEELDAEVILAEMKADLIARAPELAGALELESSLTIKMLQMCAYRELLLRQRINDALRGNMLAYATGSDLDNLGAFFGVARGVLQEADPLATPATAAILEDDNRLRSRIQLSLEGFTTCGTIGAYQFWGLSASPLIKDVSVAELAPGQVQLTVLSRENDGVAPPALLDAVDAETQARRPLTDQVLVQSAAIQNYTVEASLTLLYGPDSQLVMDAATDAVEAYVEAHHRLGHDITVSGLHAALHQSGVQNVALAQPAADLVIAPDTAAYCTNISIIFGGRDV